MSSEPVRIGVAGLGRAFVLTLPAFRGDDRVRLVAAAAPRAESRAAFTDEFGGRAYEHVAEMVTDPDVEAVYVATPHEMHAEHAIAAARAGKHILVDKPLAVSLEDGAAMVAAARDAGVHLIVGPSHSFDAPVALARKIIESGEFGALRSIQAINYTDFLYRPRRPEELSTAKGGGVIFNQAVHQVDCLRLLAGGDATRVFAVTGAWDAERPTEGFYSAILEFRSGAVATLTYSGYGHFDTDIWMNDIGELGQAKDERAYGRARRAIRSARDGDEAALKRLRTYGSAADVAPPVAHEHFGPVIAICDRADLRLVPGGVEIFGDTERSFVPAPLAGATRSEVIDALVSAVRDGRPPVQTGAWGLASLEVCHAILASARSGQPVALSRQIAVKEREPKR